MSDTVTVNIEDFQLLLETKVRYEHLIDFGCADEDDTIMDAVATEGLLDLKAQTGSKSNDYDQQVETFAYQQINKYYGGMV